MIDSEAWNMNVKRLQSCFSEGFYNKHRLDRIWAHVSHLTNSQFTHLVTFFIDQDKKPGVHDFAVKAKAMNATQIDFDDSEQVDRTNCEHCFETGVCFVKSNREKPKTLAMQCYCGAENIWNLPEYTTAQILVDWPYNQIQTRTERHRWVTVFVKHVKRSLEIWDEK